MLKYGRKNPGSTADELAEEMSLHIQEKAEALEEAGLSPREALVAARKAFGNQALLQDRSAAIWQSKLLAPLLFDLKAAVSQLRRFPVLTLTAIAIIAIGIGANTAIFSALYAATLKSLAVQDPKSLVFLQLAGPKINPAGINLTPRILIKLETQQSAFTKLAGSITDHVTVQDGNADNLSLRAAIVSDNFFDLLGVDPVLGRTFTDHESERARTSAVWPIVLDYRFWREHFQGKQSALGKRLVISNHAGIIIGVAPSAFDGLTPGNPTQLYLPIGFLLDATGNSTAPPLTGRAAPVVKVIGRLRQGVGLSEANESLKSFNAREIGPELAPYLKTQPYLVSARVRVLSASHGIRVLDRYKGILLVLQTLMAAALLLCCLNVTALQLALTYERSHEFALRVALGASRIHLMRQCLCEALFLAISGAVLSLPIPLLGAKLLPHYLTQAGSAESPVLHLDWTTFAAAGTFVLLVTILVGIIPALLAGRIHPAAVLKARSVLSRPPFLLGKILVVFQIALAFVLITTATFFVIKGHALRAEGLGFHPEHVVEVTAQFQWLPLSSAELMELYRKMLHRLSAEKDIQSVSLTWITPLTGDGFQMEVHGATAAGSYHVLAFNQVGPRYFSTLQTSLLRGREFSNEDDARHCILNSLAAKLIFPATDSVGQTILSNKDAEFQINCQVIGLVADAKYADVHAPAVPTFYLPITASSLSKGGYEPNMVFLIRAEKDQSVEDAYRDTLKTFAPTTSHMRFLPMRVQVDQALGRDELLSLATALFALIALPLCGASVLSLMGIRVKQNAADIAIRVAFGASPFHVAKLILREGLTLFTCGAVLGIASLTCASWLLKAPLQAPYRPELFSVLCAVCLLAGISICACCLPAIQAARMKPMTLLCRDS